MNELVSISDAELDARIEEVKERELSLQTDSGRQYMIGRMRELIGYLETLGYKFSGEEMALARLWANSLGEEFVILGMDGMTKAVSNWAANDTNEYRTFPQIPWIKEACKELGGDPRAEKGRRVQAELEHKMDEDHKREMEEFKKNHPDLWERAERLSEELKKGKRNVSDILGQII